MYQLFVRLKFMEMSIEVIETIIKYEWFVRTTDSFTKSDFIESDFITRFWLTVTAFNQCECKQ